MKAEGHFCVGMARPAGDQVVESRSGGLFLSSVSSSAMSPAPRAAPAPASISLLALNGDAPLVRGLSLVSQAPGEALAWAPRTSCPGIRDAWGGPKSNVTGSVESVNTEGFYIVNSQLRNPH